ncbi:MAG: type ISP restriction/modification enzyme [Marinicella pacifica]
MDNLIITDYLWFQFYQQGELVHEIRIADIENNKVSSNPEQFEHFSNLIVEFCRYISQTIKSPQKLAEMMAGKAKLLQNIIAEAVTADEKADEVSQQDTWLINQYKTFKRMLIHDLLPRQFADIYAQTVAYGMFAARLHDDTLDDFSRQEAAELIPKSNPFLRRLFSEIAGPDIDERIVKIVDNLAEVFRATDIKQLLKNFGKATQTQDPIIHFYETFLAAYNPKLRKSRGVWYTPEPVVKFIVRAVDDVLKTEFGLKDGLADTTKTTIKIDSDTPDKRQSSGYKQIEKEVHKVQILDPATGTGTFLAEVVRYIHEQKFKSMQGVWSDYVEKDLIPRLNGFEILMASYAMAHLKLDLLLKETGYIPKKDPRFNVYLTNSLEEYHPDTGSLFSNWLSAEAREANHIKRDTPVMCVIGNPPYAVSSTNKGDWIQSLIADYKKDLNERKINLDDDYIKFIRYGQHYIDKNGSGVLAYISNNSFIDGITHRQMRKELLNSFDKIYILDLHGSAKKNETAPDGSKDENVFDIQQGVSINILIKFGNSKKSRWANVYHSELFGKRSFKYQELTNSSISKINWNKLENREPNNFFIPRDYKSEESYLKGFKFNDLFVNQNSGIQTKNDSLTINFDQTELKQIVNDFKQSEVDTLKEKYNLKDTSGWTVSKAKDDLINNPGNYFPIYYRPFDVRTIYMTKKSSGFVGRPRLSTMKHFFKGNNLGLITVRQQSTFDFQHILISNTLMESGAISLQTKEWGYIFPLYVYSEKKVQQTIEQSLDSKGLKEDRTPNLNTEIVNNIAGKLEIDFVSEKEVLNSNNQVKKLAPIDILDYIYAVLHSPSYRDKYKEFLKIDFPRIPYPKNREIFWQFVKLGGEIRLLHLMESPLMDNFITSYPIDGDNKVTRKMTKASIGFEADKDNPGFGKVWINDDQYFDGVPKLAWEFYIGGYQPAQKWLKDRKDRILSYEDINHYQKIIVALNETDRLMKEIDEIEIEWYVK